MENEKSNQMHIEEKESDNYYRFQNRIYMLEEPKPYKTVNSSPREFGKKLAASLMDRIDREVTKVE